MPVNTALATQVWNRYTWLRDNGHLDYVKKAAKCEDFFAGLQWDQSDLALLKAQRRPALTINKIISTISNVMGEQIFNRTDIAFKPRNEGATSEVADALTKVFMQIADNNQLGWARSDVFTDGIVTSRGFFDVRLDFTDSLRGEVRIEQLNPKNVLIDADADEYDPDKWNDVLITKWMSPDQIELLYGKADADLLRSRTDSYYPYGYDSIDTNRDRFGSARAIGWPLNTVTQQEYNNVRNIRVIERQWKKLDKVLHFVDLETGDTRQVPGDWDDERISQHLAANPQLATNNDRVRARPTLMPDLRQRLANHSAAELAAIFEKHGLPFAPISRPEQLLDDPHLNATGGLADITLPDGERAGQTARTTLLPLAMDGQRLGVRLQPPVVGQHTAALMQELGYTPEQVQALQQAGAVA